MVASAAKNVMVPMRRKVVMVREDASAAADMNKNAYYREYDANKADVETIKLLYKSAAIVQKFARRKLVPQRCLSCPLTLSYSHAHAHATRSIWKRRGCDGRPRRRRSCGASSSSSRPGSRSGETASSTARPARCYGFRCLLPFTPSHPTVTLLRTCVLQIQSLVRLRQFRNKFYSPAADGGPSRYRCAAARPSLPLRCLRFMRFLLSLSVSVSLCLSVCLSVCVNGQRVARCCCAEEGAAAAVGRLAGSEGAEEAASHAHQEEPAQHLGGLADHHRPGGEGAAYSTYSAYPSALPPRANRWSIYYPQPVRQVGMFQEYLYPGTNDLHFYRHASTGACYFDKPAKMALLDQLAFHEQEQILRYG